MKKKIFIVALVVCIMAVSIASASIAYFTDTEKATNTFTSGDVAIEMTEAAVKADALGHLVEDTATARKEASEIGETFDYGTIFPMQTIYKDPTVENTGSEDAYLAAKIVITNGADTLTTALKDEDAVKAFITGEADTAIADAANKVVVTQVGNDWVVYILCTDKLAAKTDSVDAGEVVLFDHVNIDANWGNAEMAVLKNLKVEVTAYATQVKGFADAKTAIQTAFATDFGTIFN